MGYYSQSGVIYGLHFEESEWTRAEPDRFFTVVTTPIHAEASCAHEERLGQKFCPICGTKVRDRKARERTDKEWHHYPSDLLQEIPNASGLTHYQYTDCEITFHAIGVSLVDMEENAVRGVDIESSSPESDDDLLEKIRALELFSDVFILNHLGTWFIQGGS
jgi:hypothetical protein